MLVHKAITANDKEFHPLGEKEGKDISEGIRNTDKQNLLINDGKTERIKRRGKRMERCDKIRIKAWRSGRHQEKKRTGNHRTCKE